MKLLGPRVQNLVLLEPNPFYLLKQAGRVKSYLESLELRDHVKCFGSLGDWMAVAPRFANYWLGKGTWDAMPEKRRVAFSKSLPPNFHEWDAVMGEETTVEELKTITARTLIVCDSDTVLPIREIVDILLNACPSWHLRSINGAGHMAPITKPDLINPIIQEFLKMDF